MIIIENIDHLEAKATTGLFIEHKISFLSLNVKMVLTCPIFLVYDKHYHMVKDDFDYVQLLNMIKVRDSSGNIFEKGIETIEKIIEKRTELSLFEEGTLKFLILKSGGTLRDLFQMIREAAIEAICNERETIYQEDAEIAYRNLKSEYTRLIRTDEDIKALKEIYYDPKPSRTDGIMESLLLRGLIIEYNGERWCGIHPAVKDFLEEKGEL